MNKILLIGTLLLVSLAIPPKHSLASQDGQNQADILFEQGSTSFLAGDYKNGLELFLQARDQGLNKVSLWYNIGVCAYKLGDYPQARKAFLKVSYKPDMAPLAYYNLGLVKLKENDQSAAKTWFDKTIRTTTDPKLKKMAELALRRSTAQPKSSWLGFASLGGGYDDNVKFLSDTASVAVSNTGDTFTELLAVARRPIFSPDSRLYLQLNGYSMDYLKENEYDYSSFGLKLFHTGSIRSWQSETGVDYSYSFLDMEQYAQIPSGFIELRKEFHSRTFFRSRYTFSYLEMLDVEYDTLTGIRNRLQLETGKKWGSSQAAIEYILELNDRDNPDESPTRNSLRFKFNIKPTKDTNLYAKTGIRQSNYEINSAIDRDEDLATASLRLTYNINSDWIFGVEYSYEDNQSNDESYEYSRSVGLMNITLNF